MNNDRKIIYIKNPSPLYLQTVKHPRIYKHRQKIIIIRLHKYKNNLITKRKTNLNSEALNKQIQTNIPKHANKINGRKRKIKKRTFITLGLFGELGHVNLGLPLLLRRHFLRERSTKIKHKQTKWEGERKKNYKMRSWNERGRGFI